MPNIDAPTLEELQRDLRTIANRNDSADLLGVAQDQLAACVRYIDDNTVRSLVQSTEGRSE